MSAHANPAANGQRFGDVLVTIDHDNADCVVHVPGLASTHLHRMHLHSLEEMQATYQVQRGLAATSPMAGDIADAIKFATTQLKAEQEMKI